MENLDIQFASLTGIECSMELVACGHLGAIHVQTDVGAKNWQDYWEPFPCFGGPREFLLVCRQPLAWINKSMDYEIDVNRWITLAF